jgi:uncharacterized protein YggU (UPF0235/DUF167 family)
MWTKPWGEDGLQCIAGSQQRLGHVESGGFRVGEKRPCWRWSQVQAIVALEGGGHFVAARSGQSLCLGPGNPAQPHTSTPAHQHTHETPIPIIIIMPAPPIRYLAANATLHLLCCVKPGVSAARQGVTAVTATSIDVCVAAQPRDGEANKAVRDVIAAALRVPKSDVEIAKGLKSRDKHVAVHMDTTCTPDQEVERVKALLLASLTR